MIHFNLSKLHLSTDIQQLFHQMSTMDGLRGLALCACSTLAAAYLVYTATRRWLRHSSRTIFHQVVFFPAVVPPRNGSACERVNSGGDLTRPCSTAVDSAAALGCVLRRLQAAVTSLDVCVFVLSCPELSAALRAAHRRGCRVRVILDEEMSTCTGSQLTQLQRIGVPVFVKPKPFLMHHKFAVVDGEVLICGSFNWTRQAALGNNEDVIITNNPQLVKPFIGEFEKIWNMKR